MKKILLFVFSINFFQLLQAYPISPRPLRKLVIESDCIVQAYVIELGQEKVKQEKKKRNVYNELTSYYALLLIREVWQGKINTDTIKIYYPAGLICPAPPRFEEHTEIIAFLDKNDEGWSVHALSYGVKTFYQKEGIEAYKKKISEMQEILLLKESPGKQNAIVEWLVSCAENEYTRWEGVYELSPQSDFMSYYDRDGDAAKGIYISLQQRQRLFTALLATVSEGYDIIGLVDLCKGIDDDRLLEFLKKSLTNINMDYLWLAGYYMERITGYTNDSELKELHKEFESYSSYNKTDEEKKKKVLAIFIEKMKTKQAGKALSATGNSST